MIAAFRSAMRMSSILLTCCSSGVVTPTRAAHRLNLIMFESPGPSTNEGNITVHSGVVPYSQQMVRNMKRPVYGLKMACAIR